MKGPLTKFFYVFGKVQGVMFRKTFVYGCHIRGLRAGATNSLDRHDKVSCTISGEEAIVNELIGRLTNGEPLNSWGAQVESIEESAEFIPIENHQVHTDNVDSFQWRSGVEVFL